MELNRFWTRIRALLGSELCSDLTKPLHDVGRRLYFSELGSADPRIRGSITNLKKTEGI